MVCTSITAYNNLTETEYKRYCALLEKLQKTPNILNEVEWLGEALARAREDLYYERSLPKTRPETRPCGSITSPEWIEWAGMESDKIYAPAIPKNEPSKDKKGDE